MVSATTSSGRRLFSGILRELRQGLQGASGDTPVKVLGTPAADFVAAQFRKFSVTEKQLCRATEEMRHLATSYHAYLRSQRMWRAVHEEYHTKGERSVEETARIVGFKLPHDPK